MTQNRKGFTLIEIVIVCVVLGILAAIAIPRYSGAKDKARVAAMKADLHNVAVLEEQYISDPVNNGQYFSGTATADTPLNGFRPSPGVTVTLTAFSIPGTEFADWAAVVKHSESSESCEMKSGVTTCTTTNAMTTGILNP
jgi:prepilin-type N-terminal cleavage/methylation domain-containing protein